MPMNVSLIKRDPINQGPYFAGDKIKFTLPSNTPLNPMLSTLEIKTLIDITRPIPGNPALPLNNTEVMFYDPVSARKTSSDILYQNAYWEVNGPKGIIDQSPSHNRRKCTTLCYEDNITVQEAKSVTGNYYASELNNWGETRSVLLSSPTVNTVSNTLTSFFGIANQQNYNTSANGETTLTFETDPLIKAPFYCQKALIGSSYNCSTVTTDGNSLVTDIVIPGYQGWVDNGPTCPFQTAANKNKVVLTFTDSSSTNTSRQMTATVSAVAVDPVTFNTTLTIGPMPLSKGANITLTNLKVFKCNEGTYISIDDRTTATVGGVAGSINTLTTTQTYANNGAATTAFPNPSNWTYAGSFTLPGTEGGVTGGFDFTINAATTRNATKAVLSFANKGGQATNGTVFYGGMLVLNEATTFTYSYQIVSANLVLAINDMSKIPPQVPTYMSWIVEERSISAANKLALNFDISPACQLVMVVMPLDGGVVSVCDTLSKYRLKLDGVETTLNSDVQLYTSMYDALVSRNYGQLQTLNNLVPENSDDAANLATKQVMMISQLVEFPSSTFSINLMTNGTQMQPKIMYVFQYVQTEL